MRQLLNDIINGKVNREDLCVAHTYVYRQGRAKRVLLKEDCVWYDYESEWYDRDCLDEYNLCYVYNGNEVAHLDSCIWCSDTERYVYEDDDYCYCERCGDYFENYDQGSTTQDTEMWYCDSCLDRHYYQADDGSWFEDSDERDRYDGNDEDDEDEEEYDGDNPRYFSQLECSALELEHYRERQASYEESSGCLPYHYYGYGAFSPRRLLTETTLNNDNFIGAELEVARNGSYHKKSLQEVADDIRNISDEQGNYYFVTSDASLSGDDGAYEIVSQPMTLAKHEEMANKMLSILKSNGFVSHDTSCCGLHVHINKENATDDFIYQVIYLYDKFAREIQRFGRRGSGNYYRWYDFGCDTISQVKQRLRRGCYGSHNVCVQDFSDSCRHNNTIELRSPKGTLDFESYMACIEFAYVLKYINMHFTNEEIEKFNWNDILNIVPTKYFKKYCERRQVA